MRARGGVYPPPLVGQWRCRRVAAGRPPLGGGRIGRPGPAIGGARRRSDRL